MPTTNQTLAGIFEQMGQLMEVQGANRFKVIAFQKAARVLGELPEDIADLPPEQWTQIDGIGKGVAERIGEYLETGQIADHLAMLEAVPAGVLDMLGISGLGPKTVALLWQQGGVQTLDELKQKLEAGELTDLKGFGKKKAEQVLKSIAFAATASERYRLGSAMQLAEAIVADLSGLASVQRCTYAGSLRRGKETIGDVDILVAAAEDDRSAIAERFKTLSFVTEIIADGQTKTSVRTSPGIQADLRVVAPESFGAALMYFTGSKEHNVAMRERAQSMGMTLNEYGLKKLDDDTTVASAEEEDIFAALGLAYVPPELREDRGELKLAEQNKLPELLTIKCIQSELHTHTTASDGVWTIHEIAQAAIERGYHTLAITDHSKGQVQANGLNEDRLVKHIEAIREVAAEVKDQLVLLAGSEVDILTDGRLDYADELLAELDIVVASPHASLAQEPKKATARLLKAIENPYITILGHPTGRLVLRREGLSPDIKALVLAAKDRGIALEINANHYRLDLRDTHARLALDHGVKLAINTDAHGPADLDQLRFGVLTARRAGATKADIVNAMTKTQLAKWLKSTRP